MRTITACALTSLTAVAVACGPTGDGDPASAAGGTSGAGRGSVDGGGGAAAGEASSTAGRNAAAGSAGTSGASAAGGGTTAGGAGSGGSTTIVEDPIDGCSNVTSGWTELVPSPDTRIVYVSSSEGSDTNDGLDESNPVATIDRAKEVMRSGSPDWMLLRRGDTFRDQQFGNWTLYGPAADQPVVIGAYGDVSLPRPIVIPDHQGLFNVMGGSVDANEVFANVTLTSIHAYAEWRDPESPRYEPGGDSSAVMTFLRSYQNFFIEDVLFEKFGNWVMQPIDPADVEYRGQNLTVRRSVVIDNYEGERSQGLFVTATNHILVEECVFDHNGWNETVAGAEPTIFSHNFYVQSDNDDVTLRGNIISRGPSNGMQLRCNGLAEDNLFVENAIAGFVSGDNQVEGMNQVLSGNVVLHAAQRQLWDGEVWSDRAWGLELMSPAPDVAGRIEVANNIVAHSGPVGRVPLVIGDGVPPENVYGNVVYDWGGESDSGPFVDPERDLITYHESIGGTPSIEAFLGGARRQRKGHWCYEYTAEAVNEYVREGFATP
jgi:hypothetical protein